MTGDTRAQDDSSVGGCGRRDRDDDGLGDRRADSAGHQRRGLRERLVPRGGRAGERQPNGIDFDENGEGDLTATVRDATSNGNDSAGVRADQAPLGVGLLQLVRTVLDGDGEPLDVEDVTVVVKP